MDVTDVAIEGKNVTIYAKPSGTAQHLAVFDKCAALGQNIPSFDISNVKPFALTDKIVFL